MTHMDRRNFLRTTATQAGAAAALSILPPALRQALAIEPHRVTGTVQDVQHIVVLMQENRSFDHLFGSISGVRGFRDRFPIPTEGASGAPARTVLQQPRIDGVAAGQVAPFHLDTLKNFALMRTEGTDHTWPDAQYAWDHGKLGHWTQFKGQHSLGYFARADIAFHYALADAFTLCDAYHCSFQGGTTPNRLFLWSGSNDPHARGHGPATFNDLATLQAKPGRDSYTWTTYPERLQAAGIRWQVYQDLDDNYDDNSLAFFKAYRDAYAGLPGSSPELKARASTTRNLEQLRADVQANRLPQISWIVAPERESEHPGESSPAQGAHYTARVLEALSSNPQVWSRTVLILNYDENDGFFDHMPPPAAPSYLQWHADPALATLAGASTVDTSGEYHEHLVSYRSSDKDKALLHRPYGLGPRVPMLVISPWSRGGWVNSQVFDHTSVIRFIEQRFGVLEPNITPWRRAVCGDLTSTLDFARRDHSALAPLPATAERAQRAAALPDRSLPATPGTSAVPRQEPGTRPSRALPYELHVHARHAPDTQTMMLLFANTGGAAAVFHVYDRLNLGQIPRRYTVGPQQQIQGAWALAGQGGDYDLWVLGPNGFHRHFTGQGHAQNATQLPVPEVVVGYEPGKGELTARVRNTGSVSCSFELTANANSDGQPVLHESVLHELPSDAVTVQRWNIRASGHWYDFTLRVPQLQGFSRRFAGRMETGAPSTTDPAQS
ncbi:MAG: phospholipase C, phosphocholine-specific [Betaproteobacteria bacterium]